MNLFDNMHGLKGCIRCLTFKNVLLAHFLLAFTHLRALTNASTRGFAYFLFKWH